MYKRQGLVTGDTDDDYLVLTDIQGLEDFFGDMDFKVAGTHKGCLLYTSVFANFNDVKEGDQVEAFKMVEIPR